MITNCIFGDELLVKLSQGSQLLSILEWLEGSEGGKFLIEGGQEK